MRLARLAARATLALALLAAPLAAEAQPAGKVYQVGIVTLGVGPSQSPLWQSFIVTLRELGYVEGRNLVIRPALADGERDRLPGLVAGLVQAKVDLIATTSLDETLAAEACDFHNSYSHDASSRPGERRPRRGPSSARRQRHRAHEPRARREPKVRRTAQGGGAVGVTVRRVGGSGEAARRPRLSAADNNLNRPG